MHMYLIFDQAFGNEQKENKNQYIVLCYVTPKHHLHEFYCFVLFKFHVIMWIIFFWFVINKWRDFLKHQEICFDFFRKARHWVKVYIWSTHYAFSEKSRMHVFKIKRQNGKLQLKDNWRYEAFTFLLVFLSFLCSDPTRWAHVWWKGKKWHFWEAHVKAIHGNHKKL
jgi:hypothetical protein